MGTNEEEGGLMALAGRMITLDAYFDEIARGEGLDLHAPWYTDDVDKLLGSLRGARQAVAADFAATRARRDQLEATVRYVAEQVHVPVSDLNLHELRDVEETVIHVDATRRRYLAVMKKIAQAMEIPEDRTGGLDAMDNWTALNCERLVQAVQGAVWLADQRGQAVAQLEQARLATVEELEATRAGRARYRRAMHDIASALGYPVEDALTSWSEDALETLRRHAEATMQRARPDPSIAIMEASVDGDTLCSRLNLETPARLREPIDVRRRHDPQLEALCKDRDFLRWAVDCIGEQLDTIPPPGGWTREIAQTLIDAVSKQKNDVRGLTASLETERRQHRATQFALRMEREASAGDDAARALYHGLCAALGWSGSTAPTVEDRDDIVRAVRELVEENVRLRRAADNALKGDSRSGKRIRKLQKRLTKIIAAMEEL